MTTGCDSAVMLWRRPAYCLQAKPISFRDSSLGFPLGNRA
jgi:hypothetical protein